MGKDWDNPNTWSLDARPGKRLTGSGNPTTANGFGSGIRVAHQGKKEREAFISFMTEIMQECYRVLKPGAHGLVWALPRTSHWTATALEDAGFEIRDSIEHIFGSGFPKGANVSVMIDKHFNAEREVIGNRQYSNPKMEAGQGISGLKWAGSHAGEYKGERVQVPITAPATPESQQWSGWSTALKPAHETWWLIRKPISESSIAANVLKWGVGGLNIDQCRVGNEKMGGQTHNGGSFQPSSQRKSGYRPHWTREDKPFVLNEADGRWPANLLFSHSLWCTESECTDDCPVSALDRQGGNRKRGGEKKDWHHDGKNGMFGLPSGKTFYEKEGGASRFFQQFYYACKASKRNRSANGTIENDHPTCKNTELMKYLVRLCCPPNGIVLDCFAGSGSTLIACIQESFHFIGIEQDKHYCEIAEARIAHEQGICADNHAVNY